MCLKGEKWSEERHRTPNSKASVALEVPLPLGRGLPDKTERREIRISGATETQWT